MPRRSWSVLTNTTAGSALAAKSAKLRGAGTPGGATTCPGGGGLEIGAPVTTTAPGGSAVGEVPTAAPGRLQPASDSGHSAAVRSATARLFTCPARPRRNACEDRRWLE